MAVKVQFMSLVVPRARIAAVPGLAERLAKAFPNAWQDDHLWVTASMGSVAEIGAWLERQGLTLREQLPGGGRVWRDVCAVDYYDGPTLPCAWLGYDPGGKVAWLAGTSPGQVVGPVREHEAAPIKLSAPTSPASAPPPAAAPAARADEEVLSSERTFRVARLVCLALVFLMTPWFPLVELFGPSVDALLPHALFRGVLLIAMATQAYLLARPLDRRAGVTVFRPDADVQGRVTGAIEVPLLGLGVLGALAFRFVGLEVLLRNLDGGALFLAEAAMWTLPVLLIVVRNAVVVDSTRRRVYRLGWLPWTTSFDALAGLGTILVRGRGVRETFLGLFFRRGGPWKLQRLRSPESAPAAAMVASARTSIPVPRGR